MDRKPTYHVSTMTQKKYADVWKNSFGLGITGRDTVMGELGLKTTKTKDKLLMTRILEAAKSSENVGPDFKEQKIRERRELNQTNLLRSVRFLSGLPCRGQRTQTNAGTSKRRVGKKRASNLIRKRHGWKVRILARRRKVEGRSAASVRRLPRVKFLVRLKGNLSQFISRRWARRAYRLVMSSQKKKLKKRLLGTNLNHSKKSLTFEFKFFPKLKNMPKINSKLKSASRKTGINITRFKPVKGPLRLKTKSDIKTQLTKPVLLKAAGGVKVKRNKI